MSTRRSSSPMPNPPLGFSTTPMTRKSEPSIMTSLPTACPSGNSTGATFSPSMTTFSRCRSSPSLMNLPSSVAALAYTCPKIDAGHFSRLGAHAVGLVPARREKSGHILHRGAGFQNRLFILERQRLALPFLERRRTVVPPLVPLGDEGRIRSELLDLFLDFLVEAGDQRRHQHDHADPEHHAEDGQRAAQFVRAQRIERLFQIFAVCLRHVPRSSAVRPQRFNEIELGGAHCRKNPEKQAHRR